MAATVFLATTVGAANFTWDGGAGPANEKWSQGNNWGIPDANNVAPADNSVGGLTNIDIFFAGNIRLIPKVDKTYFIHSLTFNGGAGAFSIVPQNTEVLRIGAGGIANLSTNVQTLGISLSLSNSQIWNAAAGQLLFTESVLLNASSLSITGAFNTAISNSISGTGNLIKNGAGVLQLAGVAANTFSGGVTLNSGTVLAQKANALGTGPVTVNNGLLDIQQHHQNVGGVTLSGGVIAGTSGILTGSMFQVRSGVIHARIAGAGGMTKTTTGTVTLTSSNLYSGPTLINAGKLIVNNLSGSGTGTGHVEINNSGILAGIGTISGSVTNRPGGTISAGDSPGIGRLTTGGQVWFGGATNLLELRDVDAGEGVGWDFLSIAGGLNLASAINDRFVIEVRSLTLANTAGLVHDFDSSQSYVWTVARASAGIGFGAGEDENSAIQLLLDGFSNPLDGGTFSLVIGNGGRDLNLMFTPAVVPEPSAGALVLLGGGLLFCVLAHRRDRTPRF